MKSKRYADRSLSPSKLRRANLLLVTNGLPMIGKQSAVPCDGGGFAYRLRDGEVRVGSWVYNVGRKAVDALRQHGLIEERRE
jgi:hypothetical protein